jgi:hypothetical protein
MVGRWVLGVGCWDGTPDASRLTPAGTVPVARGGVHAGATGTLFDEARTVKLTAQQPVVAVR